VGGMAVCVGQRMQVAYAVNRAMLPSCFWRAHERLVFVSSQSRRDWACTSQTPSNVPYVSCRVERVSSGH